MSSFSSVYLRLLCEQDGQPPLLSADTPEAEDDQDNNQAAHDAFRAGLHLRSNNEPDETFWNELKRLAGSNRAGLAKLLQVSPSVIGRWPQVIENFMKKVAQTDAHHDGVQRPQMLPTGAGKGMHSAGSPPIYPRKGPYGDSDVPGNSVPL